jgi:hypothetical protein
MTRNEQERLLELEESAQGVELFRAPGHELQIEDAAEEAEDRASIDGGGQGRPVTNERLARAKARRQGLRQAMASLEIAAARPTSAPDWLEEVEVCLASVRDALELHVEEVEGHDGLLAEVMDTTPRLAAEVETMRREHRDLMSALARAQKVPSTVGVESPRDVSRLRRAITTLLGRLTQHRQRGSDLVYEAYNVDIGAGD